MKSLEEAELARRVIDAEEDAFNNEKRLAALHSANKHMHDNQDQVKAFHSKMLLCDVMQEREAQVELKKRKEEIDKDIEQQWIELERMKMDEYDDKERAKIEE